jgi:hypothetical protein
MGAGLITIVTVNEYTHDHDFNDAVIVLDQMGEPGQPFTVMKGPETNESYLNLDLLKQLYQQSYTKAV